jgi:hypothetical protein
VLQGLRALWDARRRLVVAAIVVIGVAVFAAFSGSLDNDFVNWDDDVYITANPTLHRFGLGLLTLRSPNWHPLSWLVHALDLGLFGLAPAGHHLTSVAWHAANAVLVGALALTVALCLRRPEPPRALLAGATAAALLFAVHPLRVESVAWASEKKDLLCGFFTLLTLIAWLAHGSVPEPARRRLYQASLAFTALAILSKAMAVTLPVLLLLLDAYPLQRLDRTTLLARLREKLPHLAMAAVGVAMTVGRKPVSPGPSPKIWMAQFLPTDWLAIPLRGTVLLLEKLLWPASLVPFYPIPEATRRSLGEPQFLLSGLLLAALTGAAVLGWRRGVRAPLVTWVAFLIAYLPASGIRPLTGQLTADRFSYIPSIGFCLLAGAGVAWLAARPAGRPALLVPLLAVLALGVATRRQVEIWRDSETLWTTVAAAFPGQVVMAHNNLGTIHHDRARRTHDRAELQRAAAEYRKALEIFPDHPNALNNLGLVAKDEGDWLSAEKLFRAALAAAPNHPLARANLALLYFESGEVEKAAILAEEAQERGLHAPELDTILERAKHATPPPDLFPEESPSPQP